jgi:folate-binding protein YgfZ
MSRFVDLGTPALLEFRGPDTVRFLNGQLTQDVRKVAGGKVSLPSCVTDAKGKLQFRIHLTEGPDGALWLEGPEGRAEDLEARVTRYLIADDVDVSDLTGKFHLFHIIGDAPEGSEGTVVRASNRYGTGGQGIASADWWLPEGVSLPEDIYPFDAQILEHTRILNGVPAWGAELLEGMLPPEAALEETDISYHKGCYIGQEVISRIKSAGKVNRRLTRFTFDAAAPVIPGPLENGAGELTSISPLGDTGTRHALGYVRRGAGDLSIRGEDGNVYLLTAI